jgi:hypothetical protein
VIAQRALENRALVQDLGGDDRLHDAGPPRWIIRPAVLGAPQEHVTEDGPFDPREEPTLLRQMRDANTGFRRGPHQRRTDEHLSKADDAADRVHRNSPALDTLHRYNDVLAVLAHPSALGGDIERV